MVKGMFLGKKLKVATAPYRAYYIITCSRPVHIIFPDLVDFYITQLCFTICYILDF